MNPALAILVLSVAAGQDTQVTYGKTNAQILAMGPTKWYDFFTSKAGDSTPALAGGYSLFGDALRERNEGLLARLAPTIKKRFTGFQQDLQSFKNDAIGVGVCITEGGTLWQITAAIFYSDAEWTLYQVLSAQTGSAPSGKVSSVTKELARLEGLLGKSQGSPASIAEGKKAMVRLRADFARLVKYAAMMPRKDSDAVLEFCRKTTAATISDGSPK